MAWTSNTADIHFTFMMAKMHLCTFLSVCMPGKICGEHTGGVWWIKSVEKARFLSRGGRGQVRQSIHGNALFLFFITREGGGVIGGEGGARWPPIGSSYPLDDVCGELSSAAEHTALKEAFFQRKSSTSPDPTPFQKNTTAPAPPSRPTAADPQLLPACFPWPQSKCFMWLWLGQVGGGPPPLSSEDTCFPVGWGCVGVGGVEQRGGGVQWGGWGLVMPLGRGGNKGTGALSHALIGQRLCAPVER